ncbi:MAG TPA: GntR family transcriptional regulator [Intrasporangium sp.]|nr:GntR family transcriptional regulator [Intrasporangium sp.]
MPIPTAQGLHKRALLRDHAYESIRDAIVDGTLAPGERLRDSELESWLGISRTPIREALLRLERARLVIATPGRATIVAPVDLESTIGSQQVAASMHELAARLATPLLRKADIAQLTAANRRFAEAIEQQDVTAALEADDEFHGIFVTNSTNPVIREVLERVVPVLRRVERMRFGSLAGRGSVAQHVQIIDCVRAGDAEGAARASRENWLSLRYTFDD